jgi:hypothetical protein
MKMQLKLLLFLLLSVLPTGTFDQVKFIDGFVTLNFIYELSDPWVIHQIIPFLKNKMIIS